MTGTSRRRQLNYLNTEIEPYFPDQVRYPFELAGDIWECLEAGSVPDGHYPGPVHIARFLFSLCKQKNIYSAANEVRKAKARIMPVLQSNRDVCRCLPTRDSKSFTRILTHVLLYASAKGSESEDDDGNLLRVLDSLIRLSRLAFGFNYKKLRDLAVTLYTLDNPPPLPTFIEAIRHFSLVIKREPFQEFLDECERLCRVGGINAPHVVRHVLLPLEKSKMAGIDDRERLLKLFKPLANRVLDKQEEIFGTIGMWIMRFDRQPKQSVKLLARLFARYISTGGSGGLEALVHLLKYIPDAAAFGDLEWLLSRFDTRSKNVFMSIRSGLKRGGASNIGELRDICERRMITKLGTLSHAVIEQARMLPEDEWNEFIASLLNIIAGVNEMTPSDLDSVVSVVKQVGDENKSLVKLMAGGMERIRFVVDRLVPFAQEIKVPITDSFISGMSRIMDDLEVADALLESLPAYCEKGLVEPRFGNLDDVVDFFKSQSGKKMLVTSPEFLSYYLGLPVERRDNCIQDLSDAIHRVLYGLPSLNAKQESLYRLAETLVLESIGVPEGTYRSVEERYSREKLSSLPKYLVPTSIDVPCAGVHEKRRKMLKLPAKTRDLLDTLQAGCSTHRITARDVLREVNELKRRIMHKLTNVPARSRAHQKKIVESLQLMELILAKSIKGRFQDDALLVCCLLTTIANKSLASTRRHVLSRVFDRFASLDKNKSFSQAIQDSEVSENKITSPVLEALSVFLGEFFESFFRSLVESGWQVRRQSDEAFLGLVSRLLPNNRRWKGILKNKQLTDSGRKDELVNFIVQEYHRLCGLKQLVKTLLKLKRPTDGYMTLDLVPSRRFLDTFFGYAGGTCVAGSYTEIQRRDFICVRIIDRKHGRWEGVIHLMLSRYKGSDALVLLGTEPRLNVSNKVDCPAFWQEVKRWASGLARLLGCSHVLQTRNPTAFSNRPNLSFVIREDLRGRPVVSLDKHLTFPRDGYDMTQCVVLEVIQKIST